MHPKSAISPAGVLEVSVLAGGQPQDLYRRADGRMFAPGTPGTAYTLRVRNLLPVRTEVIVTVDGRHILEDEPGDPVSCHGMVLRAHETYDFRGWRVSDSETREFLFGEPALSVAAQATGTAANTGVIGFAAWREDTPWKHAYEPILRGRGPGGQSVPVAAAASADYAEEPGQHMNSGSLGTGIGASQADRVGRTTFRRADGTLDTLVIGYDTYAELVRRGIAGPAEPQAFPGAETGYAKYASPQG
jgi:hypothetical protein